MIDGIAYTVATWLLIQVTDTVIPRIGLPDSAVTLVIALLATGFKPALVLKGSEPFSQDAAEQLSDMGSEKRALTPLNVGPVIYDVMYHPAFDGIRSEPVFTEFMQQYATEEKQQ